MDNQRCIDPNIHVPRYEARRFYQIQALALFVGQAYRLFEHACNGPMPNRLRQAISKPFADEF